MKVSYPIVVAFHDLAWPLALADIQRLAEGASPIPPEPQRDKP